MFKAIRVVTCEEDCGLPEGEVSLGTTLDRFAARQVAQEDFDELTTSLGDGPLPISWDADGLGSLGDGAPMHYKIEQEKPQ